jgi:hypothetical protein
MVSEVRVAPKPVQAAVELRGDNTVASEHAALLPIDFLSFASLRLFLIINVSNLVDWLSRVTWIE